MGCILRQSAAMKKTMDLQTILAANLTKLMDESVSLDTIEKVATRSQLGRGTVDRLKKGEVSARIETVQALADAFGKTALQMLSPNLGLDSVPNRTTAAEAPPIMQWTTADEAHLLTEYRSADDEGRDTIRKVARMVKKTSEAG